MAHDEQRPETFPVYRAALNVRLDVGGETVLLGLKETGLDAYFQDGLVLHHDLEGRLMRAADPPLQWRRGLSSRTLGLRRRPRERGGGFERRLLTDSEANSLLDRASRRMTLVADSLSAGHVTLAGESPSPGLVEEELPGVVQKAARFDAVAAQEDVAVFRQLYDDVPILPPDQYSSLALMATEGCRYNHCTFCGFYRGARFRARSPDEFRAHMRQAIRYHGRGLAPRRAIFLGQANALMGDRSWRESILQLVNQQFQLPPPEETAPSPNWWKGSVERFSGITSFLDAFVGTKISADEFASLRALNLRQVHVGMETGDAELLKWLKKPATPAQLLETVRAARSGGVHVGVIVLVGAGGEPFFEQHVEHTIELLRAMQLARGDFIYLSPLIEMPGTEYFEYAKAERIKSLSAERMMEQEQLIRAGIGASPKAGGPYVAHYEVANFVY